MKKQEHSRYRLIDDYDNDMELLGEYANMRQVQKAALERHIDTDGECVLLLYKLNLNTDKYELVNEWYYTMEG